ncbi:MAG TPA: ABC-type transport auxiliary lipoprotein family protein [Candidatus Manganitrophaceae bacterium]|nr:ABC-type transport auxiliary lipoprotein family protein [Candidatus Manganitrophaceae bacterium]
MTVDHIGWRVRALFFFFMAVVMTACAFPAQTKQEIVHTFFLNPEGMEGPGRGGAGKRSTGVLLVNLPQTRAGFDTERIAYLRRAHEVSYYAAGEWVDTPARMLAPLLVRAFERIGAWQTVVQMPSAVRGDYRIDSDDLTLGQEFFQYPSRVRLTLRAQLIDLRQHRPLGTKRFEVLEEAPSEDAYGGVLAANRAVARLLDEAAAWAAACMEEADRCPSPDD